MLHSKKVTPTLFILFLVCIFQNTGVYAQDKLDNAHLLELYQTGKFSDAAEYINSAYPDSQFTKQALNSLGYAYQMAGKYHDAEKMYLKLYEQDTSAITTLINLASVNKNRGNNQKAALFYEKVLELDSNNLTTYQRLSEIEMSRKQPITAHNYLLKANEIDPTNPTIAYNLAMFNISLQLYAKADSVISIALENDPENINLLYGKAVTKDNLKDYPEAIKTCNYLLELGSDSLRVIPILAPMHFYNKEYQKTIDLYIWLANQEEPLTEGPLYYMAVSHWKLEKYQDGFEYMDAAIDASISKNTSRYYIEKGDQQRALNQNKPAIISYERALAFKEAPEASYNLALIYDYQLHDDKSALRYYKNFLKDRSYDIDTAITNFVEARIKDLDK